MLALQGAVAEHLAALADVGARGEAVKTAAELARVDALIIPGGESTTVIRLLDRFALAEPLQQRVRAGLPLWGTCMGLIVASRGVEDSDQRTLGLIDVTVRRNAYGRQLASEEVPLDVPALGPEPFPAIFIRAPWVAAAGPGVETLASHGDHGVFVREGRAMGTAFHPELTADRRVHAYFVEDVARARD